MDLLIHYILPFFGMLIGLIVIHELGHYVTAKIFGVKVLEAGLGYPPRVWGFTWRERVPLVRFLRWTGKMEKYARVKPRNP